MKKLSLLFAALAVVLCFVFVPKTAQAATHLYFDSYDVKIKVQENNVLDVTETIVSDFSKTLPTHGILREIPTKLKFTFEDGSKKTYVSNISNIQVPGQQFSTYREGDNLVLKIGDPQKYASGKVTYIIKYLFDIGEDGNTKYDFLYYDVIGTEWNADIKTATFSVEMPKPFDAQKVWAYVGGYGSTRRLNTTINGNIISGTASGLWTNEGISLQVEMPEGYFIGERIYSGPPYVLVILVLSALLTAASVLLWVIYGRDEKVVPTVEFYAPDGLTSADVGYIIDGSADNKDITSLIIYWADRGYLKIIENEKKDITLQKLYDLPASAKPFELELFNGLFAGKSSVTVDSLKNTFYSTMESVKRNLDGYFKQPPNRVFTKESLFLQGLIGFFTSLPIALSLFFSILEDSGEFIVALVFSVIALGFILAPVYSLISLMRNWRSLGTSKRNMRLVWSLILLGGAMLIYLLIMSLFYESLDLGLLVIAATCIMAFVAAFIRKRTDKGMEWQGKLLGFKNFIEKAEKDRIERLVEQNPGYFYNVLPYAYVMGITEKWAKNFEKIGIVPAPPPWYNGYYGGNVFTTMAFIHMMNHSMNTMSTTFVSRPAPKSGGISGGSFGGGGFSGGGFGGGGGGGW